MRTRMAETIGIDKTGLTFEGLRLPYMLADEPVVVRATEGDLALVTVTFIASSVTVDPCLAVETDGDVRLVRESAEVSA